MAANDHRQRYAIGEIRLSDRPPVDRQIALLAEIKGEDHDKYLRSYLTLLGYLRSNMRGHVEEMLHQHRSFLNQLHTLVEGGGAGALGANHQVTRTAVASALNFASAVHMYQEHAEVQAARHGGDEARLNVNNMFRRAYDEHPALFLMRRLRGIMAHYTTDVLVLNAAKHRASPTSTMVVTSAEVRLDRGAVKRVPNGINAALRNYLDDMESDPQLADLMELALAAIQALDLEVAPIARRDLVPAARDMRELWGMYPDGTNEDGRLLFVLGPDGSAMVDGTINMTPIVAEPARFAETILTDQRWISDRDPSPARDASA